jgi:hypothetical protein
LFFQFFKMQVYCPNGIALPESQILGSLRYILQESESTGAKGEPVGLLTSDNRDNWYKARRLLVEGGNEEALKEVETALFTVSLDDDMDQGKDKSSLARAAAFAIHGGGPNWAAGNRWFDKTIQVKQFNFSVGHCLEIILCLCRYLYVATATTA